MLAALLAATVSTSALLAVIAFYVGFNVIESYLIAPKVFGHEMELSKLAVLIAVIVGAELGGIMGAMLALPIAAHLSHHRAHLAARPSRQRHGRHP